MKPTKQPRSMQLAEKFFVSHERLVESGRALPYTGTERKIIMRVFEWICARYSCVAMTGRERDDELATVLNFQTYQLKKELEEQKKKDEEA